MGVLYKNVAMRSIGDVRPYAGNARSHDKKQIREIAQSIERFGFTNPVLISRDGQIVCGHGRYQAARQLGLREIPTICLDHLNADELRAYALADNKIALNAAWDNELLEVELEHLIEIDFDLSLTGFSSPEIDLVFDAGAKAAALEVEPAPVLSGPPITRPGDVWLLGDHRLLCGDAQDANSVDTVLEGQLADMLFTDPPYNVPIQGHVSGLGKHQHREFAFASGEMTREEFTVFLAVALCYAANGLREGAIGYVFMDWRHMREILHAGELAFGDPKQLCVWNKTNGGMGTFYRSKHELVFVFRRGNAPHVNNFGLGDKGRYRTNVWDYPGMSSASAARDSELALHPTPKPVQLVQDAIMDCSNRGDLILDCFAGSGSTLIAAERAGRKARLIEIDPLYCDTIIRRFAAESKKPIVHAKTGHSFDAMAAARTSLLEVA